MATAAQFARRMKQYSVAVGRNSVQLTNKVSQAVHSYVANNTPVDTGQAISNWIVSIGAPSTVSHGPYVPGQFGSTRSANISATLSQGKSALANRRYGQIVYISNVLPYITALNDGWSKQAPAGYVQSAALSALRSLKEVKLLTIRY